MKDDLHRLGHLEPGLSRQHDRRQIRAANPGGKGPQGPIGTGMTVGADDQIPGQHQSLLGKEHMFDPDGAPLEGVREILLPDEVSKDLALGGRLDVLVRSEVIGYQDHPVPVKHLGPSCLPEFLDGKGGRNVVPQGDVHPGIDQHPGMKLLQVRVIAEDLFRYRHSHGCFTSFLVSETLFYFISTLRLRDLSHSRRFRALI